MQRRAGQVLLVGVLTGAACAGGGGDSLPLPDAVPEAFVEPDADAGVPDSPRVPDVVGPETQEGRGAEALGEGLAGPDEKPFVECDPGEGCFLDPCSDGDDCQSGWCVEHMGDSVCSRTCTAECPSGWTCRQVSDPGSDVVFICVSLQATLCRPCNASADCVGPGGTQDLCVSYGQEGSFCGAPCESDEQCPWGFECAEAETVDGILIEQCKVESGLCPCVGKSVGLSLWTSCSIGNEHGVCKGKRICTEAGLTACDAAVPAEETCNAADDDCDGETDNPPLIAGEYKNICDDANECTEDSCLGGGGCGHEPITGGECGDGDACTAGDHCQDGACVGLPIICDDSDPCTDDVCDGLGGCTVDFNTADCDDEDPCSVADACVQGSCVGYVVDCDCTEDADCLALDDGNPCNGTLVCNTSKLPFLCTVDPETVVVCPQDEGPEGVCTKNVCDPQTGKCMQAPDHEGFFCDDGDQCTAGDQCVQGDCKGGVPAACDDGNACTDDTCNPAGGCVHLANSAPCDDGNECTVGDTCKKGSCSYASLVDCGDGNPCTSDKCDPVQGCIHDVASGPCDDADFCTVGDHCELGKCAGGQKMACDDGNVCTKDSCSAQAGCQFVPAAGQCDDGNACTQGDTCSAGKCLPGSSKDCDDDEVCTKDTCDPVAGCKHSPATALCDDGNWCTLNDKCVQGKCQGGEVKSCDDGNPCTDDQCSPGQGCLHLFNMDPCEDADGCTLDDTCADGLCKPGAPLNCDDSEVCTQDSCDPIALCQHAPKAGACDDKNACTTQDACSAGKCLGGLPLACDDGKSCTQNLCDPASGCVYVDVVPCCGNSILEGAEECDDGNTNNSDQCSNQCKKITFPCLGDWLVGTPCNGYAGCNPGDPGYHWHGIVGEYACWWHHKNQAWNTTPATNFWALAVHFQLTPGVGKCHWCNNKGSFPGLANMYTCESYFQQNETGAWGWCGETVGYVCILHQNHPVCN
jgi:cysteine-rich repeat protein